MTHSNNSAVSTCFSVNWLTSFGPDEYISSTIRNCHDIHGSQKMHPNDFGDPLTLSVAPHWFASFWSKSFNYYCHELEYRPSPEGVPLTFPLVVLSAQNISLSCTLGYGHRHSDLTNAHQQNHAWSQLHIHLFDKNRNKVSVPNWRIRLVP